MHQNSPHRLHRLTTERSKDHHSLAKDMIGLFCLLHCGVTGSHNGSSGVYNIQTFSHEMFLSNKPLYPIEKETGAVRAQVRECKNVLALAHYIGCEPYILMFFLINLPWLKFYIHIFYIFIQVLDKAIKM